MTPEHAEIKSAIPLRTFSNPGEDPESSEFCRRT